MKKLIGGFLILGFLTGCGGGNGAAGSNSYNLFSAPQGSNVMSVTVGGTGICNVTSGGMIPNNPCTQVTLCQPGTSNCQTIPEILVDSGSTGLRIFKSAISPAVSNNLLQTVDGGGKPVAECIRFADLTALWGAVEVADVVLGGEPSVRVPIQVVDSNFVSSSAGQTACGSGYSIYQNPDGLAANGILGIDFFQFDPGPYFSCALSSSTCLPFTFGTAITSVLSSPVLNPVFSLPDDHNGVILSFPNIPVSGASSLTGFLIFGIGTKSNNGVGSGVSGYPASANTGSLTTSYKGVPYSGYIDSGTNGIAVPDANISQCLVNNVSNGFLCPSQTLSLTASNPNSGGIFQPVSFQIANAVTLIQTRNMVFNDIGIASTPSTGFIWGFPFFLGRSVYIGYEGMSVPILGAGPFWAY